MQTLTRKGVAKLLAIALLAASGATIYVQGNTLMLYRPNSPILSQGLVYAFPGKGHDVYVSFADYAIVVAAVIGEVVSILAAAHLYKPKSVSPVPGR
jgi:hypothetical protein